MVLEREAASLREQLAAHAAAAERDEARSTVRDAVERSKVLAKEVISLEETVGRSRTAASHGGVSAREALFVCRCCA